MSKITHYIFAVVALLLISTHNVCAQKERKDREAALEALGKVLGTKSEEADTIFVEQHIGKVFKKDPAFFAGVAEIFQGKKNDTLRAMKYINQALEIDDEYADAYRIAGDLRMKRCKMYNFKEGIPSTADTLAAIDWYERGTLADPKDPKCYEKYANLVSIYDIDKAENKFQTLAKANPAYPVNLSRARMYRNLAEMVEDPSNQECVNNRARYPYLLNNLKQNNKEAMEAFMASDVEDFDIYDYNKYILASLGAGHREYAIDTACVVAIKAFPDSIGYIRWAYMESTKMAVEPDTKRCFRYLPESYSQMKGVNKDSLAKAVFRDEAVRKADSEYVKYWTNKGLYYADKVLNHPLYNIYLSKEREKDAEKAANMHVEDLYNYAALYDKNRNYDKAIKLYNSIITMDVLPETKEITGGRRNAANEIADNYKIDGRYDDAIEVYQRLISKLDELNVLYNPNDYLKINELYESKIEEIIGDSLKNIERKKIIEVCKNMISKYPTDKENLLRYNKKDIYHYAYDKIMEMGLIIDDEKKEGLYESEVKQYIDFMQQYPELEQRNKRRISYAYAYLAVINYGPLATAAIAASYAEKALEYDSTNHNANVIFNRTKQYLPKKRK